MSRRLFGFLINPPQIMTTTIENDVKAASEKFYSALNNMLNGDASPLLNICSHSETVTTMHPVGGREVGWDQVRGSWEQVAKIVSGGQIKLEDQFVQIIGDVAYELGVEHGHYTLAGKPVAADYRVTNIYRRESGAWKIVHHHADWR
jgi:ketosteroid isomerase-like protein